MPNISYGAGVVSALRNKSKAFFDVHLMVEEPDCFFVDYKKAGADRVSVHVEAVKHLDRSLQAIRELGMEGGVALNPATSLSTIEEILPICSYILIMSVNPGFGGQSFIPYTLEKIKRLRKMAEERALPLEIGVDGGVKLDNISPILEAGANFIVAGSSVFGKKDEIGERVKSFNKVLENA